MNDDVKVILVKNLLSTLRIKGKKNCSVIRLSFRGKELVLLKNTKNETMILPFEKVFYNY